MCWPFRSNYRMPSRPDRIPISCLVRLERVEPLALPGNGIDFQPDAAPEHRLNRRSGGPHTREETRRQVAPLKDHRQNAGIEPADSLRFRQICALIEWTPRLLSHFSPSQKQFGKIIERFVEWLFPAVSHLVHALVTGNGRFPKLFVWAITDVEKTDIVILSIIAPQS